jgi:hypothetical protein
MPGHEGRVYAQLVFSCIHLGNNDRSVVLVRITQLVEDWGELFAVTTPWCICHTSKPPP